MPKEYQTRSDRYQYNIIEIVCSDLIWNSFNNSNSIYNLLNPFNYNEDIFNLQEQLDQEYWKLVKLHCSKKQIAILTLFQEGYTQIEIAKKLNVNQSSVTKSINGNVCYKSGKPRRYGGSIKKLQKMAARSEIIQNLKKQIVELIEQRL